MDPTFDSGHDFDGGHHDGGGDFHHDDPAVPDFHEHSPDFGHPEHHTDIPLPDAHHHHDNHHGSGPSHDPHVNPLPHPDHHYVPPHPDVHADPHIAQGEKLIDAARKIGEIDEKITKGAETALNQAENPNSLFNRFMKLHWGAKTAIIGGTVALGATLGYWAFKSRTDKNRQKQQEAGRN